MCMYHNSSSDALSSSKAVSMRLGHFTVAIVPSRKILDNRIHTGAPYNGMLGYKVTKFVFNRAKLMATC